MGGTFYNVSFVGTQALDDELGKKGAGVVISQVMPHPHSQATANYSRIEGYLAAKVFAEGLRRAPRAPSTSALIRTLESIGSLNFGGFSVSLSPSDHLASKFVEITMLTNTGSVRR